MYITLLKFYNCKHLYYGKTQLDECIQSCYGELAVGHLIKFNISEEIKLFLTKCDRVKDVLPYKCVKLIYDVHVININVNNKYIWSSEWSLYDDNTPSVQAAWTGR